MDTRVPTVVAGIVIVALGALFSACGGSSSNSGSPTAPSPPPPVSTDNSSAHYVSPAQGGQPSIDMVLFFTVSSSTSGLRLGSSRIIPQAATAFAVTGSFNTGAGGLSGSVTGTLSGSPSSGTFQGVLTTNLANGCVASENYSGAVTTSTLNWTPSGAVDNCNGTSPLSFSISTQAVTPAPITATSGTFSGPFSVPVLVITGVNNDCTRTDTDSGMLTLTLTISTNGTVTGTAHAIGTEVVTAVTGNPAPNLCGNTISQLGTTGPYETVPSDQVAGTTSNFGFADSQTIAISGGGSAVFTAKFFGAFSGNTITGVFTNSEDISHPGGCNGVGSDCLGMGSAKVTLTRQ